MFKIDYHIDGTPDGVLTDGNLIINVNGIDITKYKNGEHPYTMFYLCFNNILKLIGKKKDWIEWGSLLYGIIRVSYKNINKSEIAISCHCTVGNSDLFIEKGKPFKINKREFRKECIRVIGEFIEEVGWRKEEEIKYQYSPESIRDFVKQYDSLVEQNKST